MKLQEQADLLIQSINAELEVLKGIEERKAALEVRDRDLRIFEKDLLEKQKKNDTVLGEIEQQKQYVASEGERIKKLEAKLSKQKDYLEAIRAEHESLEAVKSELRRKEDTIDQKISVLSVMEEKEKKLEERELLVQKSEAVDRERKRLLDLREDRIRAREQQLRLDDSFSAIPQ